MAEDNCSELVRDGRRNRQMSDDQKNNMAEGRSRSRIVDQYLRALNSGKYRQQGRRRVDRAAHAAELASLDAKIASSRVGVKRLLLIEKRQELIQKLSDPVDDEAFVALEQEFIKVARLFSDARGISYESWRQMNVPVAVLMKARIYPPKRSSASPIDYADN